MITTPHRRKLSSLFFPVISTDSGQWSEVTGADTGSLPEVWWVVCVDQLLMLPLVQLIQPYSNTASTRDCYSFYYRYISVISSPLNTKQLEFKLKVIKQNDLFGVWLLDWVDWVMFVYMSAISRGDAELGAASPVWSGARPLGSNSFHGHRHESQPDQVPGGGWGARRQRVCGQTSTQDKINIKVHSTESRH